MDKLGTWASVLLGFLLLFWCTLGVARTRLYIDIDQAGSRVVPLAVPKLLGEATNGSMGQRIRTVLRENLERSGLFRVIDPATYIDETPATLDRLHYQNWSTVGAVAVIAGRLQQLSAGAQIQLDLVLHDVVQQQPPFNGKEYLGPPERYREMVHRFSDLVFQAYTGEVGPFDTQVVCVTSRGVGRRSKDIMLMDYDGHEMRSLVADGALNLTPVLSPDGVTLAYTSYRDGHPNIYLRNLLTDAEERLTSGAGLALPGSWSPDGRFLALSRTVDENSDIYLYDMKRKHMTRLTTYWGIDVSPSFAPDGHRIVFTSDRSGSPQLYLTDTRGGEPTRLTYDGLYNTSPMWSPRDDTIVFVGRSPDRMLDIYTIRADGSALRRLTNGGRMYDSPSWAPNGRFVMYSSAQAGALQRHMIRDNGQGEHVFPMQNGACSSLQWVPRTAR